MSNYLFLVVFLFSGCTQFNTASIGNFEFMPDNTNSWESTNCQTECSKSVNANMQYKCNSDCSNGIYYDNQFIQETNSNFNGWVDASRS